MTTKLFSLAFAAAARGPHALCCIAGMLPVVEAPTALLAPAPVAAEVVHVVYTRDAAQLQQEINGCRSLLLEIIRRAAYDWVLYRTSTRIIQVALAEHAYHWLFVEEEGDATDQERQESGKLATSLHAICGALDLDIGAVRARVRKLTPKNVLSIGRPAENRRRDGTADTTASLSVRDSVLVAAWDDNSGYGDE